MKIFDDKTVDLDLNGPILSFTTEPTGVGSTGVGINSTGGGSVDLIGIATVTFPNSANNDGYVTYRWHEQGVGALSDSTYVTGTATTTLTLTNLITPTDNQRKFYLEADYVPPYDGTTSTYTTGNALNEPFNSGVGTVTVDPLIEIVAQPANQTTLINSTTGTYDTGKFISFTVNANLSDSYFTDDLTYQWFIDGEAATDEVRTTTTTTGTTVSGPINNTYTTSQSSHTFPSVQIDNLEITVAAAAGARGGSDSGGSGGNGAAGKAGRFSLPGPGWLGKNVSIYVGFTGNGGSSGNRNAYGAGGSLSNTSNDGHGGQGGGAGQSGWSGGGGGGGAASYIENTPGRFIVAGGGGGGGGGSWNRPATSASEASNFSSNNGPFDSSNGNEGETKSGDGGGGGGGGGGAPGGSGGASGQDNSHGGRAGSPGGSRWDTTKITSLLSQWNNPGNGYVNIKYTGYTSTAVTTTRKTSISGSTTKTLKVACDTVGIQTAQCKISSATASNSYLMTDEVTAVFVSTATANELKIEAVGNTATASLSDIDLNNGEYTFNVEGTDADNNGLNQFYILYSPNKDIDVEMDLYGGKGTDSGSYSGGEGGYSRIRFTLEQNQEYVIAGLVSSVNAPFVYRRGILMACVGQGGKAGAAGDGGGGGGVNINGDRGDGGGGQGGGFISAGSMGGGGTFGSSYSAPTVYPGDTQASGNTGGLTIKCTKGIYWRQQGIGACDNVTSSSKFRLSDGTIVTNTTDSISRGFKAGYNIMQTAGNAITTVGGIGGNGARGGDGDPGQTAGGGGGGGSGYSDGTATVVATQQGGSTGDAKVVLRLQS